MDQLLANGNTVTAVGLLLVALVTGSRGMWLFGFQAKRESDRLEQIIKDTQANADIRIAEVKQDRDEWKQIALDATALGKRVVNVAEKTVR